MAAFSQREEAGVSEENLITISPATSSKDVEFKHDFEQLFRGCTLQAAFEHHAAFTAVFKSQPEYNEFDKFGGEFVRCDDGLIGGVVQA